ncbi:MAG: MYXO-CTERM sorting domain-containing protein [Acidobacteriota bacterium]
MRLPPLVLASALAAGLGHPAGAFAPHKGADRAVVAAGGAARAHRDVAWHAPASVAARTALARLPGWQAQWDRDTDVPLRAWGPSIAAPGTSADPAAAEAFARQFLADHLDLLAPGAQASDFVVVANQTDPSGTLRTVAFEQRASGLRVVGAGVGLLFSHDHLMLASSTAMPDVQVRMPAATLARPQLAAAATGWLAAASVTTRVRAHGDRVVLPIVRPRAGAAAPRIAYRVVETVSVEAVQGAGRWDVWVDAIDGTPVARRSTLAFSSGFVLFHVPDRYPTSTYSDRPAPYATHQVNGSPVTAGVDGSLAWAAAGTATIAPGLAGTYAAITNVAGALDTGSLSLADGGTVVWDQSANDQADAQLDSYVFENTVKAFVRANLNPSLPWLNHVESVSVNENMTCNAYSTGDDIHFFQKDAMCENTGRIADVVYHETGHSVHYQSIIPGQGQFDGSLSEGLADTLAIAITGDHGLGRGFFFNDKPLRDVAPATPKVWPKDADGEPHDEGEIIGEALWDTRVALQNKLGTAAGYAQFLKIYYNIVQRAADIPSSYAEALAADDDDGNLANGTPDLCELQAAFGRHGLADPAAELGLAPPVRDNLTISFTATPPSGATACPNLPSVASAKIDWNPRGATGGALPLTAAGDTWSVQIPAQPDGTVVEYKLTIVLSDGSQVVYPDNPADPKYQFFVGQVTPIKCWDFESGFADWTHTATPAANDEWAVGTPLGIAGDPNAAHGGTGVLGIDLGADDGLYKPSTTQSATSGQVDLGGATQVHLQYYRWLGVEDGAYDHATIYANGTKVWTNYASAGMPTSNEVNHVDKEWRFQDVDVSAQAAAGNMTIEFELKSDPGLELSGWTVDDVCLVSVGAPAPACGNGVVDTGEQCDDGAQNGATGDACSATCTLVDAGKGGGCCSAGGNPAGPIALALVTIGFVVRRRRHPV